MPYKDYEKQKANGRENYYKNKEKKKQQATDYYYANYEKRLEQKKIWAKNNKEKLRKYRKTYWVKYKKRKVVEEKARMLLNLAVEKGKITRPDTCSKCNKKGLIHAHHNDYEKPLEVEWLCHKCHFIKHMRRKENKNK